MITIDVRWINASGIGTYIRHIVPGIIGALPDEDFTLIGSLNEIETLGVDLSRRVKVVEAHSKMYSIYEQFEIPGLIPKNTRLYFSPHYPIPILYRGEVLITIHDLFHLAMPQLTGGLHKLLYAKIMLTYAAFKAKSIITVSNFTKSELIKYIPCTPSKIHPIHLGVDSSWFLNDPQEPIYSHPYLVFVGNVKPNKNLINLIQAFTLLLNKIPHNLIIIGKTSGFITGDSRVYDLAKQHPSRIIFTDVVSDSSLKRYVKGASALIFPSLYEGFGLPPLEAMAGGCPVLCSDRASLPEVCGDAVMYCNPESIEELSHKIEKISMDPALQDSLRMRGLERARQFTWSASIDRTVELVKTLLK